MYNFLSGVLSKEPVSLTKEVERGVYGSVRNLEKIDTKTLFTGDINPFPDLSQTKVKKIIKKTPPDRMIYRLQQEVLKNNREYFNSILQWMKTEKEGAKFSSNIDRSNFVQLSEMYDYEGKTLLIHAIDIIFKDSKKIYLAKELKELGIDFNQEVKVLQGERSVVMSPLAYVWWLNKWEEYSESDCVLLADELICQGASINETFGEKNLNLSIFIHGTGILKPIRFILWFLKNGGDINFRDENGNTAFYHLLMKRVPQNNEDSIARILLKKKPDILTPNNEGKNAFHLLCEHSKASELDIGLLKEMIQMAGHKSLGILDNSGHSCLYYSLTKQALLEEISKTIKNSSSGEYIFENQEDLLLSYAGEIRKNIGVSRAEIEYAVETKYLPQLRALLSLLSSNTREFLTTKDAEQGSLLHALAKGNYRLAERLVEENIIEKEDLDLEDVNGKCVFQVMEENKNTAQLVNYSENLKFTEVCNLIDKGANFDGSTMEILSPIQRVIYGTWNLELENEEIWDTSLEIMEKLLLHGVDPNHLHSINGETALHALVRSKSPKVLNLIVSLIARGADPSVRNKDGVLPLDLLSNYPKQNNFLIREQLKEYTTLDDF